MTTNLCSRTPRHVSRWILVVACVLWAIWLEPRARAANEGELEITVLDKDSMQPTAVRMHLRDSKGKPVLPPKSVSWKDHFAVDGQVLLKLRPGEYRYEIERGPEYRLSSGGFTIEKNAEDRHTVVVERFANMSKEGWWSGDLHIHRRPEDIELLMRSEDLHIGPVITWWNQRDELTKLKPAEHKPVQFDGDRFYHLLAGEDERGGGALLYFNLPGVLPIQTAAREHPPSAKFIGEARRFPDVHIDAEKPFWWDMPVWMATGEIDSIGLANNHLFRDGGLHNEAWGKARDTARYPGPQGNGRWSQDIYYQLLNCGLRIPPSAGSASGVLANPVGYNRVYVHCDGELTWERWWEGLRAGRVVVTNGPLLRARVNQYLPGHLFSAAPGETLKLQAAVDLAIRDKVEYLEIVKDGRSVIEVRLADYKKAQGKLPPITFDRSGWFLIRAVTEHDKSYRFASTGPFYVMVGQEPRISRAAAQFFLDWVTERARQLKGVDGAEREESLVYLRAARDYWQDLVTRANAD